MVFRNRNKATIGGLNDIDTCSFLKKSPICIELYSLPKSSTVLPINGDDRSSSIISIKTQNYIIIYLHVPKSELNQLRSCFGPSSRGLQSTKPNQVSRSLSRSMCVSRWDGGRSESDSDQTTILLVLKCSADR